MVKKTIHLCFFIELPPIVFHQYTICVDTVLMIFEYKTGANTDGILMNITIGGDSIKKHKCSYQL